MATFKQRDNGWWQAVIRRKNHPDQSKTFEALNDAEMWARGIENKMDRGVFVDQEEAERTTLAECLERYEREVSSTKKSHEVEKYRIRAWQAHQLANKSMAQLRATDFAKYRDERLADGLSASSVRNDLAIVSNLFTVAAREWGLAVVNPVLNIRKPTAPNGRSRRLSEVEEKYLMQALNNPGDGAGHRRNTWMPAIVSMALETACRQGELLKLEWKDVDLKSGVAHLRDTKNGESRSVPLSQAAIRALKALPRSLGGMVFPTTTSAVKQSWSRAIVRAQRAYVAANGKDKTFLQDFHFHDLRHEATTRLAGKLDMMELASVTGHKDLRMLKRYTHHRAADLAKKLG